MAMRQSLLNQMNEDPRILETHGGKGALGKALYRGFRGVVFEKDPKKVPYLLEQRPEWAVYECDCIKALNAGIGLHLKPNFIDCDPYGSPWPVLKAIFKHGDKLADTVGVVVNDGLRRNAMLGCAWKDSVLSEYVKRFGNNGVNENWFAIVRELFDRVVFSGGFSVREFAIKSSGAGGQMTHYAAIIDRCSP